MAPERSAFYIEIEAESTSLDGELTVLARSISAALSREYLNIWCMKLLEIGFGNAVVAARVKQIVRVKSATNKSWRQEADQRCRLIDATAGRHTKAMLITDSGHIILSSISRQTLIEKLKEIMPAGRARKKPARRSERARPRRIAAGH